MYRETIRAFIACSLTFVLCSICYPAAVWGVAQLLFPRQANGSLILDRDNSVIGSELIAQPFHSDKYFHPRPSAVDYKSDASGGSNLGTKNPDLQKKIAQRVQTDQRESSGSVPADLVSASGSGLDPDLSLEAASYQMERVAKARQLPLKEVQALVESCTNRTGALLGAPPRVNVLTLNLRLDAVATEHSR